MSVSRLLTVSLWLGQLAGECLSGEELKKLGFEPLAAASFAASSVCNETWAKYGGCVTADSLKAFVDQKKKAITQSQVSQLAGFVSTFTAQAGKLKNIYVKARKFAEDNAIVGKNATARLLSVDDRLARADWQARVRQQLERASSHEAQVPEDVIEPPPLIFYDKKRPPAEIVFEEQDEVVASPGLVLDMVSDFAPRVADVVASEGLDVYYSAAASSKIGGVVIIGTKSTGSKANTTAAAAKVNVTGILGKPNVTGAANTTVTANGNANAGASANGNANGNAGGSGNQTNPSPASNGNSASGNPAGNANPNGVANGLGANRTAANATAGASAAAAAKSSTAKSNPIDTSKLNVTQIKNTTKIKARNVSVNSKLVAQMAKISSLIDESGTFLSKMKDPANRNQLYAAQFQLMSGAVCLLTSGRASSFVQRSASGDITGVKITSSAATTATQSSIKIITSVCEFRRLQQVLVDAVKSAASIATNSSTTLASADVCNDLASLQTCEDSTAACPAGTKNAILTSYFAPFADKLTTAVDTTTIAAATATLDSSLVVEDTAAAATTATATTATAITAAAEQQPESGGDLAGSSGASRIIDASTGQIGYNIVSSGEDITVVGLRSGIATTSVESSVVMPDALAGQVLLAVSALLLSAL